MQKGEEKQWRRNELRLDLVNGSVIYGFSADQPERLRGANLGFCWAEELSSWRYPEAWYEGMVPALRIGEHPRVFVTTTPRPTPLIRDLTRRKDGSVHITRGSTWENAKNLSESALAELKRRYSGTRLGRQELEGELLEDTPGALWRHDDLDAARVGKGDVPDLVRVVVAVDPAMTSGEDADETGIVVAGEDGTGHGYVLADLSMRGSPEQCMRRAVRAYAEYDADCIVAEVNAGGDYLGTVLRHVNAEVPYRQVRASRGKALRAEPVSALSEQHRLHMVGCFPELEDQLCSFVPDIPIDHDDRLDAMVYAVSELRGLSAGNWLNAYGMKRCDDCARTYTDRASRCPHCNPGAENEPRILTSEPQAIGGWASAYGDFVRCPVCQRPYDKRRAEKCPHCSAGAVDFLKQHGKNAMPAQFTIHGLGR